MSSKHFWSNLLCLGGLLGCIQKADEIYAPDKIYASRGYFITHLKDLTTEEAVTRANALTPTYEVLVPKNVLPKKFQEAHAYKTKYGYLVLATETHYKTLHIWKCDPHWKNLRIIQNGYVPNVRYTEEVWDPLQSRLAIMQIKSTTGVIKIQIINEEAAKLTPVLTCKYSSPEVAWMRGSLLIIGDDFSKNGKEVRKILLYNPHKKSIQTLYQERLMGTGRYYGFESVLVSPDQSKVAFSRRGPANQGYGIWLLDYATKKFFQVTFARSQYYWHILIGWVTSNRLVFMVPPSRKEQCFALDVQ